MINQKTIEIVNSDDDLQIWLNKMIGLGKIKEVAFAEDDIETRCTMMERFILKQDKFYKEYFKYLNEMQQENVEGWERIVNDQNETIKLLCEKIEKERKQFLFALDIPEELHPQKTTHLKRIK